ncbi:hypothetical protein D3C71_1473620 [compost metagenome]
MQAIRIHRRELIDADRVLEHIHRADQYEPLALDRLQVADQCIDLFTVGRGIAVGQPFLGRRAGADDGIEGPSFDIADIGRSVQMLESPLLEQRTADEAGKTNQRIHVVLPRDKTSTRYSISDTVAIRHSQ